MSPWRVAPLLLTLVAFAGSARAAAPPAPAGSPEATPARGGVGLLEAMESPGLRVVGRVASVERLDVHGYRASLGVETVLGSAESPPDAALTVAWEELAPGRPVRFAEGDRLLVVLRPLSTASIWRTRIPDAADRARTAEIANRGEAFLHDPSLGTVDLLHHYLSLAPADRETATGVDYLASLAADARPPLARDAVWRLAAVDRLGERLTPGSAGQLVAALERDDLELDFGAAWKPLFESARDPVMTTALERAVAAARPGLASPRIFEGLAVAGGGLSAENATALGRDARAGYREVVARTAPADSAALLRRMAREDAAPGVRTAALEQLVAVSGREALPAALAALADSDPVVRASAARAAASFGDAAVAGLRSVAYGEYAACAGSEDAPRSAIASLSLAGREGRRVLARIASDHPDESLRKLASIALGSLETHVH